MFFLKNYFFPKNMAVKFISSKPKLKDINAVLKYMLMDMLIV